MKIALIGATGFIGSRILNEALERGHSVTALARNIEKLPQHINLIPQSVDASNTEQLTALLVGHEAIINSTSPGTDGPDVRRRYVDNAKAILEATRQANVKRLLVVGGAGSLEVAPGVQLVDTPAFPGAYKTAALGAREVLEHLRGEAELEWTYFSPSALIEPGQRTGQFRVGGDQLLVDANGQSKISAEDFAVALVDELEAAQHLRQRVTVGY